MGELEASAVSEVSVASAVSAVSEVSAASVGSGASEASEASEVYASETGCATLSARGDAPRASSLASLSHVSSY